MKNTIKKSLSLLLACLLVMSISVISVAAETDAVTISIGTVSAAAGEQVTVPVSIGADSGVASGAFAIDYDSAVLEFVEATDGDLELMACEVGVTADDVNQIGVAFVGANLEAVSAEGGVLFNLVFNVAENAPTQTADLKFNFEAARETDDPGLFDVDSADVAYSVVDGAVNIEGVGEYVPATVALGAVSGLPGETVEVPLTISENSYVVSGAFTIEYDGDVLDFVEFVDGELEGITQLAIADTADGAAAVGVVFSTEDATAPITAGGTIATLKFTIAAAAVAGDSALTFNLVRPDDALTQGGVATAEALDTDATFTGANVTVESAVTTTDVTFVVIPEDATIVFNGETQTAIEGYATFEGVEFGEKEYTVSADGYVSVTDTVTVAEGMAEVAVTLEEVPAPTSTTVTFNVTPADAAVTLNGVTVNAVEGVAVFENVEFGTYTYTVAKEGYVTASADVTVALDMAAVTVTLEEEVVEPEAAPVPTLQGLRTYAQNYDAETQTITVTALDTNATAGIAIVIDGATSLSQYTTDSSNGITPSAKDGYKYFVAKQSNGTSQTFNIYYTDANETKYTYVVNFKFVTDMDLLPVKDVLTLRAAGASYEATKKQITVTVDRYKFNKSSSTYAVAVIPMDGETTAIAYKEDNSEEGADIVNTTTNASKYTSLVTGINSEADGLNSAYGKQKLTVLGRSNGTRVYLDLTITKADGTTEAYTILVRQDDLAYEDTTINVASVLPLRAIEDSFEIDNDAKTIYYETTTENKSAGFAVEVDNGLNYSTRPRRLITAESGKNLAHGDIKDNNALRDTYDRYVVARLSAGLEQTYRIKVTGGDDGLGYVWYTVTVKFNRVYEGDIEFVELLTNYVDSCEFNDATNTIDVYYSGEKAVIAPVRITGSKLSFEGTYIAAKVDDNNGCAVKAVDGAEQTVKMILKVVNDTTEYTVNFHYTGA